MLARAAQGTDSEVHLLGALRCQQTHSQMVEVKSVL